MSLDLYAEICSSLRHTLMLRDLPWRTSPILRTSSLRLAALYSPNVGEGEFSEVQMQHPA
jgi:hypothetical protein